MWRVWSAGFNQGVLDVASITTDPATRAELTTRGLLRAMDGGPSEDDSTEEGRARQRAAARRAGGGARPGRPGRAERARNAQAQARAAAAGGGGGGGARCGPPRAAGGRAVARGLAALRRAPAPRLPAAAHLRDRRLLLAVDRAAQRQRADPHAGAPQGAARLARRPLARLAPLLADVHGRHALRRVEAPRPARAPPRARRPPGVLHLRASLGRLGLRPHGAPRRARRAVRGSDAPPLLLLLAARRRPRAPTGSAAVTGALRDDAPQGRAHARVPAAAAFRRASRAPRLPRSSSRVRLLRSGLHATRRRRCCRVSAPLSGRAPRRLLRSARRAGCSRRC